MRAAPSLCSSNSAALAEEQLHSELQRLHRRVEDLEDLRDLNAAIETRANPVSHGVK